MNPCPKAAMCMDLEPVVQFYAPAGLEGYVATGFYHHIPSGNQRQFGAVYFSATIVCRPKIDRSCFTMRFGADHI